MTDIVPTKLTLPSLTSDIDSSRRHYELSWAISTLRAYRSDWGCWENYCSDRGIEFIPAKPETVASYLSALASGSWGSKRSLSTILRRRAAIGHIHLQQGLADPTADPRVKRVLSGIRRELSVQQNRKEPIRTHDLIMMIESIGSDPRSIRDKALLLIGFATGCRRSELTSLTVENIREHKMGLIVEVSRSKSDQEGEGQLKLIRMGRSDATCPVKAIQSWLVKGRINEGYIFRSINNDLRVKGSPMSDKAVARAVQRAARNAGLNPSRFGGHSLRAGFITEADSRGARSVDIMAQTGHKTETMLRVYTRYNVDEQFDSSTALDLGL